MPSCSHLYNHLRQERTFTPSSFQFIGIPNGRSCSLVLIHCGVICIYHIYSFTFFYSYTPFCKLGTNSLGTSSNGITQVSWSKHFSPKDFRVPGQSQGPWTLSFVKMWFLPLREFGKYSVALLLLHKTVNTEVLGTTPLATL